MEGWISVPVEMDLWQSVYPHQQSESEKGPDVLCCYICPLVTGLIPEYLPCICVRFTNDSSNNGRGKKELKDAQYCVGENYGWSDWLHEVVDINIVSLITPLRPTSKRNSTCILCTPYTLDSKIEATHTCMVTYLWHACTYSNLHVESQPKNLCIYTSHCLLLQVLCVSHGLFRVLFLFLYLYLVLVLVLFPWLSPFSFLVCGGLVLGLVMG